MRKRLASLLLTAAKILPLLIILSLVVVYIHNKDAFSMEKILTYTPDNLWLAALVLTIFYAVKSLSIFFPLVVLYASAGMLFPIPAALLVNTIGLAVCVTVPYGVGQFAGADLVDKLEAKYPKIARLGELQQDNELFFAFFLRIIQMLPGDVVSMVLGASGMRYWRYFIGSLLGLLPVMIPTTIAGSAITDPTSPVFIVTVSIVVLLTVSSFLTWRLLGKKKK